MAERSPSELPVDQDVDDDDDSAVQSQVKLALRFCLTNRF